MLQMAYCFAAVMFNAGSLLALRDGQLAWASTDPVMGTAGMSLYGLFLSAGLTKSHTLYRWLMSVVVVLIGYSGVVSHLLNIGHLDLYQSFYTWVAAISINSFGLALNLAAAFGWFRQTPQCRNKGAVIVSIRKKREKDIRGLEVLSVGRLS